MKNSIKRIIELLLASAMLITASGCAGGGKDGEVTNDGSGNTDGKKTVLKVAALESAYGDKVWKDICEKFEDVYDGVEVELTIDKNIEDVIGSRMKAKDYPDVVYLATGRPAGLTETMIKENALTDISDIHDMKIPGENNTVGDKLLDNFMNTAATNPYGDGKTYLAPIFYSPCGLFYNAGLFRMKGWSVPTTWDEMWKLGDTAKAEGIYLFTYPTAGYMDSLMYALLAQSGGIDFFDKCMNYKEGIWDTDEAKNAFNIAARLLSYTDPTTVANANGENYLKNQQLILDNKALFMPNGTWVSDEMKDAQRADGFEWGFMALPANESGDRYSYNYFEQVWIPSGAKNADIAKAFIAFLYSDKAVERFAEAGAVQPVKGVTDKLGNDKKLYYKIYDDGAKAVMGQFAATEPVEGVTIHNAMFDTVNSVVSGDKTTEEWISRVKTASDKLRAALK